MQHTKPKNDANRNRKRATRIAGAFFAVAGIALIVFGALETRCFALFSEGGPFHYPGFGFGSFMFANIAVQAVAYCLAGAVFILLGWGCLRLRRWTVQLMKSLLWAWQLTGLFVVALLFLLLLASKDLSPFAAALALFALGLSYFVLPGLVLRFLNSPKTVRFCEAADPAVRWPDLVPVRIAVLCVLYLFHIAILLSLLLFKGVFPVFGAFVHGTFAVVLIAVSALLFALLIFGTLRQRLWAWRGACLLLGLLTVSTVSAFLFTGYGGLLAGFSFPPAEMRFLSAVPAKGWHLAVLFGLPLLSTLSAVILSRRFFVESEGAGRAAANGTGE